MKLSHRMRELYDKVPVDWGDTPWDGNPARMTPEALERRGLIEYRLTACKHSASGKRWQWRRKPGVKP